MNAASRNRRYAPAVLIAALGFFAIAAQTLLVRDFLGTFEGTELAIGLFFGAWFFWIAVGAWAARRCTRLAAVFPPLALLYLPAYALEHGGITAARGIAGVAGYEAFPYGAMLVLSLICAAPVSLITGFLFTLACRWWETATDDTLPVARVYVFETLGAVAGGVAVTCLLALHVRPHTIFLGSGLLLALALIPSGGSRRLRCVPALLLLVLMLLGLGGVWARYDAEKSWSRILNGEAYLASFSTAEAEYQYGRRGEQFIVSSSGGIVETLPNAEHGAEVAALILAQRPESKRVVVVGLGALCLCLQLLRLPQIEVVTWLHPDPEFPGALASVLPEEYRGAYKRLNVQAMDPRAFLKGRAQSYEIAVVDLPDVTTLALNRYASREFFALLRDSLVPDGVAAFRVTGAANYLGGELACLGGSAVSTFMESFPQMAIKPGDETWLLGSNREVLSEDPAVLRERLSTISGIEQVYPPGGLLSLYVPERIAFQRARYEESIKELGAPALLNTDHHPKALLFALFVALRQGRLRGVAENLFVIQRSLCCAAWLGFFAALLMRLHYLRSLPSRAVGTGIRPVNPETGWGIGFLVFCAGLTGIGTSILILFSFQAHFGSLSLYIGLFSALFMVGSVAAGQVMERVMRHRPQAAGRALSFLLTVHVALMLAAAAWGYKGGAVGLGAAMFLAGGVTGAYFPLSARRLLESGQDAVNSGGFLETADHLGAALGGLVTGLVLLPFLGINPPSVFFAMLLALSLPLIPGTRSASLPGTGPVEAVLGPLRYVLTAFVGVALLTSANVARLHRVQEERHFEATARSMLGNVAVEEAKAILPDGRAITYFTPAGPGKSGAYAFEASVLAPGVRGYGGAIDLGTAVRADGTLQEVRILRSRETPSYLELVRPWIMQLEGKRFFGTHGAEPVDGVSGATITSNAILDTLRQSVPVFAQGVLHLSGELSAQTPKRGADRAFLWLTGFFVAAVLLRRRPGVWRRRLFLAASVAVLGYGRNLQYSAQHVFSLLSLESFPEPWTASFFLIVLLPILTIGAGNVYCGYVCPFGALQELVGDCRPRGLDTGPSKPVWRYMRWVKYGLLCLLAVLFALTRDFTLFGVDPLVTFWGQGRGGTALYLALAVLALSFFFPRFWCRNLCPAGAFLALFKKVRVFRRLSPSTFPARCDLGVRNTEELDCIHCDRCAHAKE